MSSLLRLETIFSTALEKKTAEERTDYLDQACGAEAALRGQVERLLDAHPHAMDFLAQPAVDRRQFNSHDAPEDLTSVSPTSDPEAIPRDRAHGTDMVETLDDERAEDVQSALSFLQPSEKPGSLGRLAHYEVMEVLGKGGFGIVVKALDEKLHRRHSSLNTTRAVGKH
jgi:hypothetical protein